jgi:hypothetical protein
MNGNQLVRMGITFENTYPASMEQHCLRLSVALSENLVFLIEDGNIFNAYTHATAQGPTIFLIVDEVFQACIPLTLALISPLDLVPPC